VKALMPEAPVLLVADGDEQARRLVETELGKRYGSDYQVLCARSDDQALQMLARLREAGRSVAIVLASWRLAGMTGTELLGRVREYDRTIKRVLLFGWGDQAGPVVEALAVGQIDTYIARPVVVPDETFHRAITELLDEWARSHPPGFEVARVIGEEWSARSHEIRDLLGRNGLPFGFYPAGSERGAALVAEAGAEGAALPVIVLFDGRVLQDPSNTQVAEALGLQTSAGSDCYDVAVVGAGPAGLAAAVYGASRGCPQWCWSPRPSADRRARAP
jgi:thioredoxin reductase (NADPH)